MVNSWTGLDRVFLGREAAVRVLLAPFFRLVRPRSGAHSHFPNGFKKGVLRNPAKNAPTQSVRRMYHPRSAGSFRFMGRIPILLWVVALPATFLIVGCAGSVSHGGQDPAPHQRGNAKSVAPHARFRGERHRLLRGHLGRGGRRQARPAQPTQARHAPPCTHIRALALKGRRMSTAARMARKGTATNTTGGQPRAQGGQPRARRR